MKAQRMNKPWRLRLALAGFVVTTALWIAVVFVNPRTPTRTPVDSFLFYSSVLAEIFANPLVAIGDPAIRHAPHNLQMHLIAALVVLFWTGLGTMVGTAIDKWKSFTNRTQTLIIIGGLIYLAVVIGPMYG